MAKVSFSVLFAIGVLFSTPAAHADFVLGLGTSFDPGGEAGTVFFDTGPLDGHGVGSTATFTSGADLVILTTTSVGPAAPVTGTSVVNTTAGSPTQTGGVLGVNAGGEGDEQEARFDSANGAEFWSFSFDRDTQLTEIDFGLFTNNQGEFFTVTSASLGTLTFNNNGASDIFSGSDSDDTVFSGITIGSGEVITLAFQHDDGGTPNAVLEGIQFNVLAVPEPTTLLTFGAAVGLLSMRRRKI